MAPGQRAVPRCQRGGWVPDSGDPVDGGHGGPSQTTWGAPGGWFRFVSFAATARTLGGTRPQRHNKSGGRSPTDQATNMGGGDFYLHLGPGLAETDIVSGHAASCNLGGNHGGCWDNREYFAVTYDNTCPITLCYHPHERAGPWTFISSSGYEPLWAPDGRHTTSAQPLHHRHRPAPSGHLSRPSPPF